MYLLTQSSAFCKWQLQSWYSLCLAEHNFNHKRDKWKNNPFVFQRKQINQWAFSKQSNLITYNRTWSIVISLDLVHDCTVTIWTSKHQRKNILFFAINLITLTRVVYKMCTVVWHLSLPLINGFNKTEAATLPCGLCFLRVFPFISWIYIAKLDRRI